jgi:hypothetical protein
MNTTERIRFVQDFLTIYEQARGDFLSDESLKPFTDEQLALLGRGFEECADSILFYQRKVEHERVAKEICQRLFTLAIEDGALPQQTDEKILGLEPVVEGFLKAGASTEEVWPLLHDEYQRKIKPRLQGMG